MKMNEILRGIENNGDKLREKEKAFQDVRRDKRMSASVSKGHRDQTSTHMESA